MTTSTLHIVFSDPATESLKKALHDAGRTDRVVCNNFDNLALGPIDPPDLQARLAWMDCELGSEAREDPRPDPESFWREALRPDVRKIAWMSRRSAPEYCAFLEWLWRLGDLPCEVIDLADMPVGSRYPAFTLAELAPEEIASNCLWDRAVPLDAAARERHHSLWRRLLAENAALRIVDAGGLRSAPITFFDQQLLSFAKASWQKPARIIAETICEWVGSPMEPYFQAGDGILARRIIALVEAGALEGRGDLTDIRRSEVRLSDPGQRSTSG